jgi:hypothetical protein
VGCVGGWLLPPPAAAAELMDVSLRTSNSLTVWSLPKTSTAHHSTEAKPSGQNHDM